MLIVFIFESQDFENDAEKTFEPYNICQTTDGGWYIDIILFVSVSQMLPVWANNFFSKRRIP